MVVRGPIWSDSVILTPSADSQDACIYRWAWSNPAWGIPRRLVKLLVHYGIITRPNCHLRYGVASSPWDLLCCTSPDTTPRTPLTFHNRTFWFFRYMGICHNCWCGGALSSHIPMHLKSGLSFKPMKISLSCCVLYIIMALRVNCFCPAFTCWDIFYWVFCFFGGTPVRPGWYSSEVADKS